MYDHESPKVTMLQIHGVFFHNKWKNTHITLRVRRGGKGKEARLSCGKEEKNLKVTFHTYLFF